jgi:hypothetical protein
LHPQRFQQQAGRANTVHCYALGRQQQLDSLKNVRLIVGNQNPDLLLLIGDGLPPLQ